MVFRVAAIGARKDAPAIAKALHDVVEGVLEVVRGAADGSGKEGMRFIHLVSGDGINTNLAAMKRLLKKYEGREYFEGIQYRVIFLVCSEFKQMEGGSRENDCTGVKCSQICLTLSPPMFHLFTLLSI